MKKQEQNVRILTKDDSDLFQLVQRLTSVQPPAAAWDMEREAEPVIRIELPFSVLLQAVERLPVEQANLLHRRLEVRLARAEKPGADQQAISLAQ